MKRSAEESVAPRNAAKENPYPFKSPPPQSTTSIPSRDVKVRQPTPIKLEITVRQSE
jgi:hypothetical protein